VSSTEVFDVCLKIVADACALDAKPADDDRYEKAMHDVGKTIIERITRARYVAEEKAIAKIIDPDAFANEDREDAAIGNWSGRRADAVAKARRIIMLRGDR
jgi:hypothetical protein